MASKKGKGLASSATAALRRLLSPLAGGGRGLFGLAIMAILLIAGGYLGWAKWGRLIEGRPQYALTADSFETTPQPPWIQSDVKAEVMRDGSLAKLSILDPDLTKRVVQAFELNTWVAEALWAGKRQGSDGPRVIVQLRYREPVIMVRTRDSRWKGDCFWPVDTDGVFLPPDEFSASQTRNYLRVEAGNSTPVGAVGTPYGDPGVAGAASIATVIREAWKSFGLEWIVVHKDPSAEIGQPPEPIYVLLATGGNPDAVTRQRGNIAAASVAAPPESGQTAPEIFWGHAPGHETAGEAIAAQKLARLQHFVKQNGCLDQLPPDTIVDLRPGPAISVVNGKSKFQPASLR